MTLRPTWSTISHFKSRRTVAFVFVSYLPLAIAWSYVESTASTTYASGVLLPIIMCVASGGVAATLRLSRQSNTWSARQWISTLLRSSAYALAVLIATLLMGLSMKSVSSFQPSLIGLLSLVEVPLGVGLFGFVCVSWVDGSRAAWYQTTRQPVVFTLRVLVATVTVTAGYQALQGLAVRIHPVFTGDMVATLLFVWVPLVWAVTSVISGRQTNQRTHLSE